MTSRKVLDLTGEYIAPRVFAICRLRSQPTKCFVFGPGPILDYGISKKLLTESNDVNGCLMEKKLNH
jgi:hypothetical protein